MRVADRNAIASPFRITDGQLELLANCRDIANIIEERNIAEGGADVGRLCRVVRNCGGRSTAVDEKEVSLAKLGHQFGHHARVGSDERALVVVDARRVRDGLEHLGQ